MYTGPLNALVRNFAMGFANEPSSLNTNFRIATGPYGNGVYDSSAPYGRHDGGTGDAGWCMILHEDENKVGINMDYMHKLDPMVYSMK